MNDRALATRVEDPRAVMAEWRAMTEQARVLVSSGFLPKAIRTPEQAIAVIQTGKEMGIPPMRALRQIHIIEGKPTLSAELMHGLVLANLPGSVLRVVESTDEKCVVEAARPGQKLTAFVWTMAKARQANLTGKSVWKNYPAAMLRSRCVSEACRAVFPDISNGVFTPEELGGEGDQVAAQELGAPVVTDTKPTEKAPEQIPDWVESLVAEYGEADSEEKLTAVVRNTIAQLKERGGTDLERGTLNRARADAKKRIAEAKPSEAPPTEPDDDSADPEAREAEADGYREGFE